MVEVTTNIRTFILDIEQTDETFVSGEPHYVMNININDLLFLTDFSMPRAVIMQQFKLTEEQFNSLLRKTIHKIPR